MKILFKRDIILLQICWSTRVPKILKIELTLTKLMQIKMVQFFGLTVYYYMYCIMMQVLEVKNTRYSTI